MSTRVAVRKNSYKDSVRLLEATRAILGSPGVSWGWALMATPANLETLAEQGIAGDADGAAANDLVLAVRADDDDSAAAALETAEATLFAANAQVADDAVPNATDLAGALAERPDANVAIISVPGSYAALETHKALTAGRTISVNWGEGAAQTQIHAMCAHLLSQPTHDRRRVGGEKVIVGRGESQLFQTRRIESNFFDASGKRGGDVAEQRALGGFLDDDSGGVQLLTRIALALQHAHAPARAREQCAARERVDPAPDDDCVVVSHARGPGTRHR